MKERYDAVLAHVYMYQYRSERPRSSIRGHMQVSALSNLYKERRIRNIFIAGGQVWGENYPPLAEVMREELIKRGVNEGDIVIKSQGYDTPQEVDLFIDEAKEKNWQKLADLANQSHRKRISAIYARRNTKPEAINAEDVLYNVNFRGRNPYRRFLERFKNSELEKSFKARDRIIRLIYKLGLEKLTSKFAQSSRREKFEPNIDC